MPAFIEGIGGLELLMVFIVVLLLFGGEKLPGLARTIGKTMSELKKASGEVEREIRRAMDETPARPPSSLPAATPAPTPDSAVQAPSQPETLSEKEAKGSDVPRT